MRILQIEDDGATAQSVELMLKSGGFNVFSTDLGEEGADLAKIYEYDAILLDLNLPDVSGRSVLRDLRASKVTTPIIVLTGDSRHETKVDCLNAGADDYMTKPFHKDELVARIHAVVRRSKGHAEATISAGPITLDVTRKQVMVRGVTVHLTGKEYGVLEALALRKGAMLTKETLMNSLYGGMDEPELKIIDVFICKVRKKLWLHGADLHIQTIWGRGYVLVDDPAPKPQIASRTKKASPFRDLILGHLASGAAGFRELTELRPGGSIGTLRGVIARLIEERQVENVGSKKSAVYRLVQQGSPS